MSEFHAFLSLVLGVNIEIKNKISRQDCYLDLCVRYVRMYKSINLLSCLFASSCFCRLRILDRWRSRNLCEIFIIILL